MNKISLVNNISFKASKTQTYKSQPKVKEIRPEYELQDKLFYSVLSMISPMAKSFVAKNPELSEEDYKDIVQDLYLLALEESSSYAYVFGHENIAKAFQTTFLINAQDYLDKYSSKTKLDSIPYHNLPKKLIDTFTAKQISANAACDAILDTIHDLNRYEGGKSSPTGDIVEKHIGLTGEPEVFSQIAKEVGTTTTNARNLYHWGIKNLGFPHRAIFLKEAQQAFECDDLEDAIIYSIDKPNGLDHKKITIRENGQIYTTYASKDDSLV